MKRFAFLMLFLSAVLCFVGCGNGEERLTNIKTTLYENGEVGEITLENLTYDEYGKEISREIYKNDKFYFEEIREYDTNGFLIYKKYSPVLDSVIEEYYTNDSAGRPIKIRSVGSVNGIASEGITEYTYNDKGKVLTEINRSSDNTIIMSVSYEYLDENGSYKRTSQNSSGMSLTTEHTLDEHGNEIQQINYQGDRFITHNRYNDNGKLVESVNQDKNWNTLTTTVYDYDEENRLIRETLYNSQNVKSIVIEYTYSKS